MLWELWKDSFNKESVIHNQKGDMDSAYTMDSRSLLCHVPTNGSLGNRVQWFWLFFTFWGITTHPDTLRVQGFRNWQKKYFNFIHGLRKFLAKTGKCVFLVWFQSLILGAPFERSLPASGVFSFPATVLRLQRFVGGRGPTLTRKKHRRSLSTVAWLTALAK